MLRYYTWIQDKKIKQRKKRSQCFCVVLKIAQLLSYVAAIFVVLFAYFEYQKNNEVRNLNEEKKWLIKEKKDLESDISKKRKKLETLVEKIERISQKEKQLLERKEELEQNLHDKSNEVLEKEIVLFMRIFVNEFDYRKRCYRIEMIQKIGLHLLEKYPLTAIVTKDEIIFTVTDYIRNHGKTIYQLLYETLILLEKETNSIIENKKLKKCLFKKARKIVNSNKAILKYKVEKELIINYYPEIINLYTKYTNNFSSVNIEKDFKHYDKLTQNFDDKEHSDTKLFFDRMHNELIDTLIK